jgi:type IV pilus assembly protein PilY1
MNKISTSPFNKKINTRLLLFIVGIVLPILCIAYVRADDTEVFLHSKRPNPKVMLVLDTSLSMRNRVSDEKNRLTTMQEALTVFIGNVKDIDIGFTRMNENSGAIVYPVTNLNEQFNESIQRFNRTITAYANNASEKNGKTTVSFIPELLSIPAGESKAQKNARKNANKIAKAQATVLRFSNTDKIGLRFTNIIIPQGQEIEEAFLQINPRNVTCKKAGIINPCGSLTLKIHVEMSINSLPFEPTDNNITSRISTGAALSPVNIVVNNTDQVNWYYKTTNNYDLSSQPPLKIDGIKSLIQGVVNQTNWTAGKPLTLIIDTSGEDKIELGGIANSVAGIGATLFIKTKNKFTRTISGRQKLIEEIYNQRLTLLTPTVPALFDTIKYLTGAQVGRLQHAGDKMNLSRSATREDGYYKTNERLSHHNAYQNGTVNIPKGCYVDWLNVEACRDIELTSEFDIIPTYISPLKANCEEVATIVLLTDGQAHHGQDAFSSGKWWQKTTKAIQDFLPEHSITCTKTDGGLLKRGYPTACSKDLIKAVASGIKIGNLTTTKKIKLHTIGFDLTDPWLEAIALIGRGRYYEVDGEESLLSAFVDIGNSILADTTTFSSPAISINNTHQLTHDSNIYYTLFAPSDKTSWQGNLKKYKLSANGHITDRHGVPAVDKTSGKFVETAQSYWSSTADGNNVITGGATENFPNGSRTIYIDNKSGNGLIPLNNTPATITSEFSDNEFNSSDADRLSTINWMLDSKIMADPLHSTPVTVVYAATMSSVQRTLIFFGDNQGYIHAIDAETGQEQYAFIPRELLKNQLSISQQQVGSSHIYGMDGKIVTWNSHGKKYLLSGMRRGGSSYYALDISNINKPQFAWKIKADGNYSQLGQTWSTPQVVKIRTSAGIKQRLIFGGGYDTKQDRITARTKDMKGDGVYLVDPTNGHIIDSKKDLGYSIPSDVKVIDINGDNTADQVYVGDMGGRILRFNINGDSLGTAQVIADIANNSPAGNRRFYHAPDVSFLKGSLGLQLLIAIGSGYHANPKNVTIEDEFYVFKQLAINSSLLPLIEHDDLQESTLATKKLAKDNTNGWYFKLNKTNGEKVLSSSVTANSELWFSSFMPNLNTSGCSIAGGSSQLYRINIINGQPSYYKTMPDIVDGKPDSAASCTNRQCDISDRFITLHNATIPPSPVLIHVPSDGKENSGSMVCVGTYCQELDARKVQPTFWREGK